MTIVTDSRCTEYHRSGHPEKPIRVARTTELLKSQKSLDLRWASPESATPEQILRVHSAAALARLATPQDFDGDTPFHPGIGDHARRSVGGALRALSLARAGESAFSLMRPPGHHATREHAMGFCYLASLAIAAREARATGVERIALFDFDVHHGNGTEDCVGGVAGITFASVHQHPCYPGTGTSDVGDNCFNHPVAPGTPRSDWRKALERALERAVARRPQLLGISAGFDAYAGDPLADGTLVQEDFHWLGSRIRALGIPSFSILEGGYSLDLPDLVMCYLNGLEGH